jgi:hypothetical protein
LAAQPLKPNDLVRFRLRDQYLIIVQTMVNGAGPFDFLLDTGTTRSVIDPGLARQLQAPVVGEDSLAVLSGVRRDELVRLDEVSVGGAAVSDLGAMVDKIDWVKFVAPGIRGVLGEDFLSRFDILIDYKQRWLRFGESTPAGERCRFESLGKYRGIRTTNRLLVKAEFMEVNGGEVQLQLDTGAKVPELFAPSHDSSAPRPWGGAITSSSAQSGNIRHTRITLRVGATMVRDLDVIQDRRAAALDAVGLLPAAIFSRIYISHSGGFVVLNPVEEKTRKPRGTHQPTAPEGGD